VTNRVNEEKLLNEMFILLEYSDSFHEFVGGLSTSAYEQLTKAIKQRDLKENNNPALSSGKEG